MSYDGEPLNLNGYIIDELRKALPETQEQVDARIDAEMKRIAERLKTCCGTLANNYKGNDPLVCNRRKNHNGNHRGRYYYRVGNELRSEVLYWKKGNHASTSNR